MMLLLTEGQSHFQIFSHRMQTMIGISQVNHIHSLQLYWVSYIQSIHIISLISLTSFNHIITHTGIHKYMDEMERGHLISRTVKLIMMGEPQCGKTSLIKSMTHTVNAVISASSTSSDGGGDHHMTPIDEQCDRIADASDQMREMWRSHHTPRMEEFDNRTVVIDMQNNRMGVFHVYDFAGQEEYHAWQSMYLTTGSLFVVAVDASGWFSSHSLMMAVI